MGRACLQVCLGVSHEPTERIKLEDNKLLREQQGYRVGVCGVKGGWQQGVSASRALASWERELRVCVCAAQFICIGNSLYEPPSQQQQASSSQQGDEQVQTLPYCEGLEVGVP